MLRTFWQKVLKVYWRLKYESEIELARSRLRQSLFQMYGEVHLKDKHILNNGICFICAHKMKDSPESLLLIFELDIKFRRTDEQLFMGVINRKVSGYWCVTEIRQIVNLRDFKLSDSVCISFRNGGMDPQSQIADWFLRKFRPDFLPELKVVWPEDYQPVIWISWQDLDERSTREEKMYSVDYLEAHLDAFSDQDFGDPVFWDGYYGNVISKEKAIEILQSQQSQ